MNQQLAIESNNSYCTIDLRIADLANNLIHKKIMRIIALQVPKARVKSYITNCITIHCRDLQQACEIVKIVKNECDIEIIPVRSAG